MDNTMNEDNIDDVLSVIQGLPEFSSIVNNQNNQQEINVDNMEVPSSTGTDGLIASQIPYVIITEQPASKALRFRYRCEGRSAGSILGVNSTPSNKTYPTIKVIGYNGPAVVIVSCVTKDDYDGKYKTHPHNLVGMHSGNQNSCDKGVCIVYFSSDNNMEVSFPNLGIQCMKRRDIEDELTLRQSIQVDPFGAGFDHKHQPTTIDLNVVRLCFHVYIQKNGKGRYKIPLEPIVSDPIYGKKAFSDLVICELSHCSASAAGGSSMILLCEKVAKEDIKVRFFEEKNGEIMWEGYGEFLPTSVHKQVAISFKTPKYDLKLGENPVNVFIQLLRPSDGATSKPINFMMIPVGADEAESLKRKKPRTSSQLQRSLQFENENIRTQSMMYSPNLVKPEPNEWNQKQMIYWNQPGCSTSAATGGLSPFYQDGNSPIPSPNLQNNRIILSPYRTPSPMENLRYDPPVQEISSSHQYYQPTQIGHLDTQFQNLPPIIEITQPTQIESAANFVPNESLSPLNNINIDSNDLEIINNCLNENNFAGLKISTDVDQITNEINVADDENLYMSDSFKEKLDSLMQGLEKPVNIQQ